MAVRRLSNNKTVHVFYDIEYAYDEDCRAHLPDLRVPILELGYEVQEHFVDPENIREATKDIPRQDRNHIMFLHIDMPRKVPIGTKIETVRYMEKHFKYLVGFRAEYCENTVWKSVMMDIFAKHNVAHIPFVRVETEEQLKEPGTLERLRKMKRPYFVKVDDGYNSLGLSNNCVLQDLDSLLEMATSMIRQYGALVIQRFVGGREYTVAVTHGRAYHPVERIFAEGQLVSEANGTATETLLDPTDHARIHRCQELALQAYNACGGSAYGRVDLREDPETGEIFVLEVNNTCSMAEASYFQISVEALGSSKKKVLRDIIREAEHIV